MGKNIIIIVLLILNACCIFIFSNKAKNASNDVDNHNLISICNDYQTIMIYDSNRYINDLQIITPEFQTKSIENIIENGSKLIIRISELNCEVCIDSVLKYTQILSQNIGADKIAVFAKYNKMRDLKIFINRNKYDFDIYDVNDYVLKLDVLNQPYAFILNNDYTISHVFLPHKEIPNLTKWYFEVITKYLNKN